MDTGKFFAKVRMTATCWYWTGAKTNRGYGVFGRTNGSQRAHKISYELVHGPVPEGLQIDHLCRHRDCVNPAHLEAVTARENLMRGQTLAAANAAKTHCPQGHPFTEANTYRTGGKRRLCRTCCKARNDATAQYRRDYYKKKNAHHIIPPAKSK